MTAAVRAEEPHDLWLLSGQSNACGRAKLPGPGPDERVQMFDTEKARFVVAQDPLPGMNTKGMGPWVAAGQAVAHQGIAVQMVGYAMGGQPISFWHRGQPGDLGLMPLIENVGQKAGVFLWYQGESDTLNEMTLAGYVSELKQLVGRVRKQANNPNLLVVIVQLGAYTKAGMSGFTTIREAQRQFVAGDPHALLVPALGRTLGDAIHMDNAANRELGAEIGRALLRVHYRKAGANWPGPVLDAAILQKDQKQVVAHFAEVQQLHGGEADDFAVLDEEGTVRCTRRVAGKTLLTLDCERTVRLPARLIYGYGQQPRATLVDEAGNRAPAVQMAITTGPPPEDKETSAANGAGGIDTVWSAGRRDQRPSAGK
jgi:hypothetical protein